MRNRLWDCLQEAKFKSVYLSLVSKRAYLWGNIYSFLIAFGSAGSIAAWSVWESYPVGWALIVAFSQLLILAKPFLPYIRSDRELFEMSFFYEAQFVAFEKLWFQLEKSSEDQHDSLEQMFYTLREKEPMFIRQYKDVYCPSFTCLMDQASEKTLGHLERVFNI